MEMREKRMNFFAKRPTYHGGVTLLFTGDTTIEKLAERVSRNPPISLQGRRFGIFRWTPYNLPLMKWMRQMSGLSYAFRQHQGGPGLGIERQVPVLPVGDPVVVARVSSAMLLWLYIVKLTLIYS